MPKKKYREEVRGVLDLEGKLPDVIKHLQEMLNRYGPDAEIDYEYDYNDRRYLALFYYREETDDEMARREAAALERAKTREAREREQYLALKAKFEKGPQA